MRDAPRGARIVVAGVCMELDRIRPMFGINKELSLQFVLGYTPDEFAGDAARARRGQDPDRARSSPGSVGIDGVADAFETLARSRGATRRSWSSRGGPDGVAERAPSSSSTTAPAASATARCASSPRATAAGAFRFAPLGGADLPGASSRWTRARALPDSIVVRRGRRRAARAARRRAPHPAPPRRRLARARRASSRSSRAPLRDAGYDWRRAPPRALVPRARATPARSCRARLRARFVP